MLAVRSGKFCAMRRASERGPIKQFDVRDAGDLDDDQAISIDTSAVE